MQRFPIKVAKAVTPHGYEGELEAIKQSTDFTVKNIGNARNLFMCSDSQSAI